MGAVNAAMVDKIKADKQMYTRFKAAEAFKDLEKEVEKYEEYKKDQGIK